MDRRRRISGLVVAACAAACTALPVFGQSRAERVQALLSEYHQRGVFDGAALVTRAGEPMYSGGFGLASRVWGIQNRADTRFLIGSVTKLFTAVLVLQLVEDGVVSLSARLSDYLPEYASTLGERVTVHQALSHTSGIPDYYDQEFFENHKDRFYPKEEFVDRFISRDLAFDPGASAAYSSANYYLLGLVIEEVTGESYAEVLSARIFRPLGMADSGLDGFREIEARLASGYINRGEGYETPPFDIPESSAYAAGAMYSTVEDLSRFDRALSTSQLIGAGSLERLTAAVAPSPFVDGMFFAYGALVGQRTVGGEEEGRLLHQAAGNTPTGFTSVFTRIPEDQHAIVLLANTGPGYFSPTLREITDAIVAILYEGN